MAYCRLRDKTSNPRNRVFELPTQRRNPHPTNKKALRRARRRASCSGKWRREDTNRTFFDRSRWLESCHNSSHSVFRIVERTRRRLNYFWMVSTAGIASFCLYLMLTNRSPNDRPVRLRGFLKMWTCRSTELILALVARTIRWSHPRERKNDVVWKL